MKTTSYTDNAIFENHQVNAICDLLFTKLVEQFPPDVSDPDNDYVYKGIILSGNGAKILNGGTATPLQNIVFECDEPVIFEGLPKYITNILKCKMIVLKNRILFYPFDFYFEIWFAPSGNKESLVNDIYVQQTAFINPETL